MIASPRWGFVGLNPLMSMVPPSLSVPFCWSSVMPAEPPTPARASIREFARSGPTDSRQPAASNAAPRSPATVVRRDTMPPPSWVCATHPALQSLSRQSSGQAPRASRPAQPRTTHLSDCCVGSSTAYGPAATMCAPAMRGLAARATESARERPHAALDPRVTLVEYLDRLVDGIANRPPLDWSRVQVAQHDHVAWPAPETLAHDPLLRRVHHHDEVGGADQVRSEQTRAVL